MKIQGKDNVNTQNDKRAKKIFVYPADEINILWGFDGGKLLKFT